MSGYCAMESVLPRCPSVRRIVGPKLVGRAEESGWLLDALDALEDGRGACLFVAGDPGIGKTRLVEEATEEAGRRGVWVIWR
jgi:MoxR-like ATPase